MADPTDITSLSSWFDASQGLYDATSGGNLVTTDLGSIASWEPRAGAVSGRITQATSSRRPKYDATKVAVSFPVGPGGLDTGFVPNSYTINRRDHAMFMVIELTSLRRCIWGTSVRQYHTFLHGTSDNPDFFYDGTTTGEIGELAFFQGGQLSTGQIPLTNRILLGWNLLSTEAATWVNGTKATRAALTAGSGITPLALFTAQVNQFPVQATVKHLVIYTKGLSDSEVTNTLVPWSQDNGVSTSYSNQIICVGDSITQGYGCEANRSWVQRMTLSPTIRQRISAEYAIQLATLYTGRAVEESMIVAGQTNVLVLWAGTNDIANAGQTGAQVYTKTQDYCNSFRTACTAAGATAKVVTVTPLPRGAGAISGEYANLRTLLLENGGAPANAVADPIGDATLAAAWGNGTYDYDDIHPNDAGYAIIAPIIQAKIEQVLTADVATPGLLSPRQHFGLTAVSLPITFSFPPHSMTLQQPDLREAKQDVHPPGQAEAAFNAAQVNMPPMHRDAIILGPWQPLPFLPVRVEGKATDHHVDPPQPDQFWTPIPGPFSIAQGPWNRFGRQFPVPGTGQFAPVSPPPGVPPTVPPSVIGSARQKAPGIPRAPQVTDERIRPHIDKVASLLNSLLRRGYIRSVDDSEWEIVGGGFSLPRAPVATDDQTVGAVVGSIFVNTLNNSIYICVNNSAGSAVWRQLTLV